MEDLMKTLRELSASEIELRKRLAEQDEIDKAARATLAAQHDAEIALFMNGGGA